MRQDTRIYVCNLEEMPRHVAAVEPSHLISMVAPEELPATPSALRPECHLRIACHDIVEPWPGAILPEEAHVEAVIAFARRWDGSEPMLVHCVAGVSRSMATALTVAVLHAGGRERALAQRLRELAPHAWPNRRIIALADVLLGCDGTLSDAVAEMGPGEPLVQAPLVAFPIDS